MARIEKRLLKDGTPRYKAIIRRKGVPMKTKTFRTWAQAAKWAKRIEVQIHDHRVLPSWEAEKHTVAEMIDRYISEVLPTKKPTSQYDQSRQLGWWRERLGEQRLIAVTPPLISECRSQLARERGPTGRKRKPATVNRYLAVLSHAFSIAVKDWGWLEGNPLRKVSRLKEPRGRVRVLDDHERERLLASCRNSYEPRLYSLVVLALSTGARQGELLRLKWQDIDFNRGVAVVHETKNKSRKALPITGLANDLLRNRSTVRRIDSDYVFSDSKGNPSYPRVAWERALKEAQIADFRFHDLRHSAASYLAMNGATLAEIAEVLGHKTLAMVKRYSHLTEQHTSKVVARMNEQIFGSVK